MYPKLERAAKALLLLLPLRWSRAIRYRRHSSRWPSLRHPRGLNEKINWRILYDRRDIWNWTCDKIESKRRALELSPGILIPEVLWFGTDLSELRDLQISGRWILKSNGSSQDVFVGQGPPDVDVLERVVDAWKSDFQWRVNGEIAYAYAQPGAILERWISRDAEPPYDYKVFVFDGVARFVHVHTTRFSGHRASVYTPDWIWIEEARQAHILPNETPVPPPPHLEELLRRAEQIGAGFDFIRVDLYDTAEGVWFGETTPYSWSGFRPFTPERFENELGDAWKLPSRADLAGRRTPPSRT